jgi:acyl carrier protein
MMKTTTSSAKVASEEDIREWLVNKVATLAKIERSQVDISTSFVDYGLDSRQGVSLSGDLEKWLNRELDPTLVWEYPSIDKLSTHLAKPSHGEQ